MYVAKISGSNVKIYDIKTSAQKITIACSSYGGVTSAIVEGDNFSVSCRDGKVRVYDIKTGANKRTF
jgi:hypothetical protein